MTMGEIYAAHARAVFRCLLVWSRNAAVAEDLTAETFYRAIVSRQIIRSATARGYLITIARNVWRRYVEGPESPRFRAANCIQMNPKVERRAGVAVIVAARVFYCHRTTRSQRD